VGYKSEHLPAKFDMQVEILEKEANRNNLIIENKARYKLEKLPVTIVMQ